MPRMPPGLGVILDVVYNHIGPAVRARPRRSGRTSRTRRPRAGETRWTTAAPRRARMGDPERRAVGSGLSSRRASPRRGPRDPRRALARARPGGAARPGQGAEPAMRSSSPKRAPKTCRPLEEWGHDAIWLDAVHHHLHVLLTGERDGYYEDFGSVDAAGARADERAPRAVYRQRSEPRPGRQPRASVTVSAQPITASRWPSCSSRR